MRVKTFAVFSRLMRQWWHEPVDYLGQVQFFSRRSLADAIKTLIGAGSALVAAIATMILLPAGRPGLTSAWLVIGTFAAVTVLWSWMWCWRPWPSRTVSSAFVMTSDIGIAAITLVKANWLAGLFGLNVLALISVYLLFFGGPKALALHAMWVLGTTLAFMVLVGTGDHFGVVQAVKVSCAVAPVVIAPLGVQFGIWVLRGDANKSVTDPLTSLLNRRGLQLHFSDVFGPDRPRITRCW